MLDLADDKVSYYSTDDISQIIYDLLDDGDAEEAMAACQKGLDQHPEDEFLELIEAKILLHMNRYDEAEKLVKGNPDEQSPFGIGIHFGIDVKTKDQEEAYETLFRHLQKGDLTGLEFVEIIDELFDHLPHHLTAEYITKAGYQGPGSTGSVTYCNYKLAGGKGKLFSLGTVKPIQWKVEDYKLTLIDTKATKAARKKAAQEAEAEGKTPEEIQAIKDSIVVEASLNQGKTWIGWASANNGGDLDISPNKPKAEEEATDENGNPVETEAGDEGEETTE